MRSRPRKVTKLPTADQFQSFTDTVLGLKKNTNQCIWYLPDKGRCCKISTANEDSRRALQLASSIRKAGLPAAEVAKSLVEIAENSCCRQCHRNKMQGSGLAQKLAIQWHTEIREALGLGPHNTILKIKSDGESIFSFSATFAKHCVFQGESLCSTMLSKIGPGRCKTGSLYIYTHAETAFQGMIKIGYTSNPVQSRLDEWATCGHGCPQLLGFFNNVRHPERVEKLVHFELVECWYEIIWCLIHQQSHIEWFKIDFLRAKRIAGLWCQWMEDADPYDDGGRLAARWVAHMQFLAQHENPITAEAMAQIQRIEEGSDEVDEFIEDKALRKRQGTPVKREEEAEDKPGRFCCTR